MGMFSISLEEYYEVPSCDPSSPQPSNHIPAHQQNQQFSGEIIHNRCIGTAHYVRPLVLRFEPTGVYMSSQQPISSPLSSPSSTQQGTLILQCMTPYTH